MCRRLFFVFFLAAVSGSTTAALGQYDPHLVGWWTLDEGSGTVAYDYSGHGNDGSFVNDPQWVSGVIGGALQFGGDGDDQVKLTTVLPIGSSSNTVALWINVPLTGTGNLAAGERVGDILGNYPDGPNSNWELHAAGQMRLWWNNGQIDARGTTDLRDDTWHHVAWVRDQAANACTMYIDGQVETSTTTIGTDVTFTTTHRIAGDNRSDPPCFHGLMDGLQVYSRALSQDELAMIMKGPVDYRKSSSPQPPNEAVDVLRDVVLGWSAGMHAATHDVYLGTSFADVDEADRASPLDTLLSQGQATTTFDPGRLEFGQTYFWRVDEVNAAPDNTIFRGDIWSFSVEPLAYPIANVTATSNAAPKGDVTPDNTVNGSGLDAEDRHSVNSSDMWLGIPDGADPVSIQYDFDAVYKLHQMLVWNYNVEFEPILGFGFKDVTVEYSTNGADWTVLQEAVFAQATALPDYAANTVVDFAGVAVKSVKLTVNSGYGPLPQYGLSEVRFMYVPVQARNPQPADRQADTPVTTDLTWRAGRQAVSHDVYLGTDPEALALADVVSAAGYTPAALDLATVYYWQVNEVNEAEAISTWQGAIWSFSTEAYVVVDDFEAYDDEDNRIYDTWLDGWVNETRSTVGYLEEPYAEQTIVNTGRQAMPLLYDNGTAPFYSEAQRDLGGMDFDMAGADTLTLFVYASSAEPLYVALQDSAGSVAVVAHPDPAVVADSSWQQWLIPYGELAGINLNSVATIYVGVGDRNNPTAGGAGTVFIDDIAFGKSAAVQ